MYAQIKGISYYTPETRLDNRELAEIFPDLPADKIFQSTGIRERRVVSGTECASDLAFEAALSLFRSMEYEVATIDYLLFCTQTPDYVLPTTACLLQHRLGIPPTAGAFDFSLGCSGFVVGVGIAKALIETAQASRVLLLTGDTSTRKVNSLDRSVRTLFGDGAAATLIEAAEISTPAIGPFVNGTDGRGAKNLMIPAGGMRTPCNETTRIPQEREGGNIRSEEDLYMNGPEIFTFTLREVPKAVSELLERAQISKDEIDFFVFHQANRYILEFLRKKLGIPEEKFPICIEEFGNTSSSTIPITLAELQKSGRLHSGHRLLLLGFGVGYSWSGTIVTWP